MGREIINRDRDVHQWLRLAARRIFERALESAEPGRLVQRVLSVEDRTVLVGGQAQRLGPRGGVLLLAAGTAAAPMARAAGEILGPLVRDGLAVVRDRAGLADAPVPLIDAGHPVPDRRSVEAAHRMLGLARAAVDGDLVLGLFSGGASSLLCAPAPPLSLEDLRHTTELLIRSGATIDEINRVRRHLSLIKGGGLAREAAPAALATLLLSDVVGDGPETIASGPTVPDSSTFADALSVLETRCLADELPGPVLALLHRGADGEIPDTPGPEDPCFRRSITRVAGSNADALRGAAAEAERLGFRVTVLDRPVTGEASAAATLFGDLARSAAAGDPLQPVCFISGGETTVTLPLRHGRGGRNMELALAVAPLLADCPDSLLLSAGTDGTDGPTDAAGAIVDSRTMDRARAAGLDPLSALRRHDSYPVFQALGDLVVTGPTLTNVMDLQVLLADPKK